MRCGAFGDMVLLTVLLRQLHARFGKPVDVISSGPWTQSLLEAQSCVGRLFMLRSRRLPYRLSVEQHRLVNWLRERGSGPTWFGDRGIGRELLGRAGIPEDYICEAASLAPVPGESFAERYLRFGALTPRAFEGLLPPARPGVAAAAQLQLDPAACRELEDWLVRRGLLARPLVVIHPGCRRIARRWLRAHTGLSKYWPKSHWVQVVRTVREVCPHHAIVLSGTGAERALNAAILRQAAVHDAHNLADELNVRRLLPLLQRAHSMISVDTGPAHAAAALGCPTVALFGNADPDLFRPGGATTPAIALTGTEAGRQSILGITPEAVITAWVELIHSRRPPESVKSVNSA